MRLGEREPCSVSNSATITFIPFCCAVTRRGVDIRPKWCKTSPVWLPSHQRSGSTDTPSFPRAAMVCSIWICMPPWASMKGKWQSKRTFIVEGRSIAEQPARSTRMFRLFRLQGQLIAPSIMRRKSFARLVFCCVGGRLMQMNLKMRMGVCDRRPDRLVASAEFRGNARNTGNVQDNPPWFGSLDSFV